MSNNTVNILIENIKSKREIYLHLNNPTSSREKLIKHHDLEIFEWCILNLEDSINFLDSKSFHSYAQSVYRSIMTNKNRDKLVIEALKLTFIYLEKRSYVNPTIN